MANCISCHNADPTKPGSIGPEVQGASVELLRERIMNAAYPAGYQPKRKTTVMPKQPQLVSEVEALAAFLK